MQTLPQTGAGQLMADQRGGLAASALDPDPMLQFRRWFDEALSSNLPQPEAMTIATASRDGRPSARMVLLKGVDDRGFEFFTNYLSRKGRELQDNPHAALVFHWESLGRQVRVEGTVVRLSSEESDAYFRSRPLENQLSSWASMQSELTTREELDRKFEEVKQLYRGRPVPRPQHWGGYRVVPERMEFWQRRFARMNDRVLYARRLDGTWSRAHLAP